MDKRVLAVTLVALCVNGLTAVDYPVFNLEEYCGTLITLPCTRNSPNRAGTLRYNSRPSDNCTAHVALDSNTTGCEDENFAIYFNIKNLNLSSGDYVTIRETSDYDPHETTVVKQLFGGPQPSLFDPTSVAQLLSEYSRRPILHIQYNQRGLQTFLPTLVIDYNVVHELSNETDSNCAALNGTVRNDLICDTSDRINCPSAYEANVTYLNPAPDYAQGYEAACGVTPHNHGLSTGAIVGIVLGSVAGALLLAALIAYCCWRSRRERASSERISTVTTTTTVHDPVLIASDYPDYSGRKASYGAVGPTTPYLATTDVTSEPAKQQF